MLRDLDKVGHERIGLRRRYEAANTAGETHIWCWDGRNHNERRKKIYPKYKSNREPMAEDRFSQIHVFREALTHSNAIQIECDGWEADDIIGSMVCRFVSRQMRGITVHTNDADYQQLGMYRGVILNGVKWLPVDPYHVPTYKALVGDKSDAIDGIRGFGPDKWLKMKPYHRDITTAIETGDVDSLLAMPFTKAILAWLTVPENFTLLQKMLQVTKFIPVPDHELEKGIKKGTLNREAADQLFRKFFL